MTELDAAADAEPGKILHELRYGEMAVRCSATIAHDENQRRRHKDVVKFLDQTPEFGRFPSVARAAEARVTPWECW